MRSKKRWLYLYISAALTAAFIVTFGPLICARSLRAWLDRLAREEGSQLRIGKIEAPLGQTISIYDLHLTSTPQSAFQISLDAAKVQADLNFASLLGFSHARLLRRFAADSVRLLVVRPEKFPAGAKQFDWSPLQRFVADRFEIAGSELRVENGATTIALNGFTLQASELESGNITIRELETGTPWFRKNFPQIRGATSWQESRLTIGAVSLMRGLDLESITIDLGHLADRRLSLQTALDLFGGKLRANISSEDHPDHRTWDVAGAASEISLAQLSDGLEFANRASGFVHASKFTFRGSAHDLANATASAWAEISGLTWRDRTADTIMIGASLYNRSVQLEQLYVKQRKNQLNANGVFGLPEESADWLNPDFRGDISASIKDLGDFARLFGANAPDFAGEISAAGNVSAQNRKLTGQFNLEGKALRLLGAEAGSLKARASLNESQLVIDDCELWRDADYFQARGNVDMRAPHDYSGDFHAAISEIARYRALLPASWGLDDAHGNFDGEWNAAQKNGEPSGTFQIHGSRLHFDSFASLKPFDAELQGEYSARNVFFRQFQLKNEQAIFSAFVTSAADYFQLQQLQLSVNGHSVAEGNIFLPIPFSRLRTRENLLAAVSAAPMLDFDLTIHPADLGDLALAVAPGLKIVGYIDALAQIHGDLNTLAGDALVHLRDFAIDEPTRFSADVDLHVARGAADLKGTIALPGSDLVRVDLLAPFQFRKEPSGFSIANSGTFSALLDFPAIFLNKLPRLFSRGFVQDGILNGELSISNSLAHPLATGEVQLIAAKLADNSRASGRLAFTGANAAIDFVEFSSAETSQAARGSIDLTNLADLQIKLQPRDALVAVNAQDEKDCISAIHFESKAASEKALVRPVGEVDLRGSFGAANWTLTILSGDDPNAFDLTSSTRTFRFCREGEPLVLRPAPAFGL